MQNAIERKKRSFWLSFLKWIAIIVGVLAAIIIAFYCFFKYSLGIDLIDIKNKIALLNKSCDESSIVTKPFDNNDAIEGFNLIFNENNIYTFDGENYNFDSDQFLTSYIEQDATLTDVQFASCVCVYFENIFLNNIEVMNSVFELKEIQFNNLLVKTETTNVDVKLIIKLDFLKLKNKLQQESITNFILNLIPNYLFFTNNLTLEIDNTTNEYIINDKGTIINQLSAQQSKEIINLFDMLSEHIGGSETLLFDEINTILFGNNTTNGFLTSISNCSSFNFVKIDEKICIVLKKD